MKHGSLFSGIGGFDLAAEWMGWENVFHCEWNPFGQKVLNYYWPNAKSYGDITKTDFTEWRGKCDIVTGGFPCQPYSTAGKRKGKEDDRHLWPEMLRAIREIQPTWIVGENVPGLLNWERGMVLAEIKADLEASGFEVLPPCILPACGKNAPHRRDRLWIIAYSKSNSCRYDIRNERQKSQAIPKKRFDEHITTSNSGKIGLSSHERIGELEGGIGLGFSNEYNTWEKFPTQSPVLRGNDGLSDRVDRVKALGNAIVPQVAYEIFKAIDEVK